MEVDILSHNPLSISAFICEGENSYKIKPQKYQAIRCVYGHMMARPIFDSIGKKFIEAIVITIPCHKLRLTPELKCCVERENDGAFKRRAF